VKLTDVQGDAPKIEFPCEYPIKVMGLASETFQAEVLEVVGQHAAVIFPEKTTTRPSARGNYLSVTVVIEATGEKQIQNLFAELMGRENVKLVI